MPLGVVAGKFVQNLLTAAKVIGLAVLIACWIVGKRSKSAGGIERRRRVGTANWACARLCSLRLRRLEPRRVRGGGSSRSASQPAARVGAGHCRHHAHLLCRERNLFVGPRLRRRANNSDTRRRRDGTSGWSIGRPSDQPAGDAFGTRRHQRHDPYRDTRLRHMGRGLSGAIVAEYMEPRRSGAGCGNCRSSGNRRLADFDCRHRTWPGFI